MRKNYVHFAAAVCGVLALSACAKDVMDESQWVPNSRLTVMTRDGGTEDETVAYPVRLYVFDASDACVAVQTLNDETSQLSLDLPEGSYGVYAIGSADDDRLTLPSKEEASKTSAIRLREGKVLEDLMMAQSTVSLAEGSENLLTLGLERKVILMKSVTIKNVPASATNVSISVTPLKDHVLLNGSYEGENGSATIALTKQEDGTTWKMNANSTYLLPSVGKPTVSVNIATAEGSKSYSYTCAEEFAANYKVNIEGTYKETSGTTTVTLSGTITGVTWAGEKSIRFSFNESGSEAMTDEEDPGNGEGGDGGTTAPVNVPEVGTLYLEKYLVLSTNGNKVTILYPTDRKFNGGGYEDLNAFINNGLVSCNSQDGIGTWSLPTESEVKKIINSRNALSYTATPYRENGYFYKNGESTSAYGLKSDGSIGTVTINGSYLRPVTTITIE